MNELKPCPFCGIKMLIVEPANDDHWPFLLYNLYHEDRPFDLGTDCPIYPCVCIKAKSKERAIEIWNRRAENDKRP